MEYFATNKAISPEIDDMRAIAEEARVADAEARVAELEQKLRELGRL